MLHGFQRERRRMMARRAALPKGERFDSGDLAEFDRVVRDYRDYLKRADAAVAEIGATANHAVVIFLSADAMYLRSLELYQAALKGKPGEFKTRADEANAQMQLALQVMVNALFLIGVDDPDLPV
jgi:hypothetical protein